MKTQFKAARRASVPIIVVETADQQSTVISLTKCNETVSCIQQVPLIFLPLHNDALLLQDQLHFVRALL